MSFVGPPFRHDIFISYSHGDVSGDGQSLLRQWSQAFVVELERELKAFDELGAEVRIFIDQHYRPGRGIDPMSPLNDTLQQEIGDAAILAVLMSPKYLSSAWCRQEREWWLRSQAQYKIGHEGRIAVARIWPTDGQGWPSGLVDSEGNELVGHFFYDRRKSDVRPQPFSWPMVTSVTVGDFRDALLSFVGNVRARLLKIKTDLDERSRLELEKKTLRADGGQVIYLHGRPAQHESWDKVGRDLEEQGYTVLPLAPETLESDPSRIREVQQLRIETMSGCEAVMLLGTDDARALSADLVVIGRLDRHQAVARSNRILPCAVADTAGVFKQSPQWSRKAANLGIDWFDASQADWIPQVRDWLHRAAQ